ncbi:MAG: hypothetical protein KC910_08280, partial [Candidatus Eremiobacteraeota bacterium]|nr:hypothetical protein [Candidatus Eremiobacteraeota bacterium]
LAYQGSQLVGAAALWDQRAYKQSVVEGYAGPLTGLRGLVNGLAGNRLLPPVGEELAMAYLACWVAPDPDILARLIGAVASRARRRGLAYLCVGMLEGDPLWPALRGFFGFDYSSLIYRVAPGEEVKDERLDYLELGTL